MAHLTHEEYVAQANRYMEILKVCSIRSYLMLFSDDNAAKELVNELSNKFIQDDSVSCEFFRAACQYASERWIGKL